MSIPAKVVWSEGRLPRPPHLQQQERHHEARPRQSAPCVRRVGPDAAEGGATQAVTA